MTVRVQIYGIAVGEHVSVALDADGDGAVDSVVEGIMGESPRNETITRIPVAITSLVNAVATSNVCTLAEQR